MKTKKSISKRVKKTKKDKLIIYKPNRSHNLSKKERKTKRSKKSVKQKLWKRLV